MIVVLKLHNITQNIVEQEIKKTGKNKLLATLMPLELVIGKYVSWPFGICCLVTCRK